MSHKVPLMIAFKTEAIIMENSSYKDRMLTSIAKTVAHPARYRKHFRIAGAFLVVAGSVYLLFGSLAFFAVIIVGGVAARLMLKNKR